MCMADSALDSAELLARVQREEARTGGDTGNPARGTLKVFFGMAPGVGKTYAMLAAAQRMAARGGMSSPVSSKPTGRTETEQMLLGLDMSSR